MTKPSIKSTAIAYAVQAVQEHAYENVDYHMRNASDDIRNWWNGLSYSTERTYTSLVLNLREQGHFRNERTPYFYSLGLGEFFAPILDTADAERAEHEARYAKFAELEAQHPELSLSEIYELMNTMEAEQSAPVATDTDTDSPVAYYESQLLEDGYVYIRDNAVLAMTYLEHNYNVTIQKLCRAWCVLLNTDTPDTDDTMEAEQSAPVATDTDDDAPWQTIYTGPYTIHTDTDSMTFEWRSEAEEMADLLTANGARITLDWNYRPITIGEIVGINVKSYTPSPRWAVIGVMRNRLGLIVYVLQNEDGVTQQYYGLSILRLQPNTYHVPVVDILTVDIAIAHLAEYMVNMHNMHPQMCNAMHDDLMSDMLDDLLDAKWREVTKRMHATHADDAPERLEMMFEYEAFAEWVSARKMALEYTTA